MILQREAHEYFKFLPDAVTMPDTDASSSKVNGLACHTNEILGSIEIVRAP